MIELNPQNYMHCVAKPVRLAEHELNQRLKAQAWNELKVKVEAVFGTARELSQQTRAYLLQSRTLRAKRRFTQRLNELLPPAVAHICKKFNVRGQKHGITSRG